MPRTARASVGDYCYHAINRGNGRAQVFHTDGDYQAFLTVVEEAGRRVPMRVLAYCLMPTHVHLAMWPYADGDLSRWMQWVLTAHVRRYHEWYGTNGHVWQGRFKAFPIEPDGHLLTVLRYIERNPVRAGLVSRAEEWRWSSARWWQAPTQAPVVHPGPVERTGLWLHGVNQPMTEADEQRVRHSVNRGTLFGTPRWVRDTAVRLGLEATLRKPGRPRKGTGTENVPVLWLEEETWLRRNLR